MAGDTHERGETIVWPSLAAPSTLVRFAYPFFLDSVYVGLVPSFSDFFYAILFQFQTLALHLQPNSIILLFVLAFYCEDFMGVRAFGGTPSSLLQSAVHRPVATLCMHLLR
ncbi:hypothetical protein D1007_51497 [Hordeum vulgare]|nr:hypothetical protein D1007_51497 [Hordeum vulgare]